MAFSLRSFTALKKCTHQLKPTNQHQLIHRKIHTTKQNFNESQILLEKVKSVLDDKLKDEKNYKDERGVTFVNTTGFTRDDVNDVRLELMKKYHVMNCHTFKQLRVAKIDPNDPVQKMYPIPFDGLDPSRIV